MPVTKYSNQKIRFHNFNRIKEARVKYENTREGTRSLRTLSYGHQRNLVCF